MLFASDFREVSPPCLEAGHGPTPVVSVQLTLHGVLLGPPAVLSSLFVCPCVCLHIPSAICRVKPFKHSECRQLSDTEPCFCKLLLHTSLCCKRPGGPLGEKGAGTCAHDGLEIPAIGCPAISSPRAALFNFEKGLQVFRCLLVHGSDLGILLSGFLGSIRLSASLSA